MGKYGTPATLRLFEYKGSTEYPDGIYDGHDLGLAAMKVVYSAGRTPREAIIALCKARLGKFDGALTPLPTAPDPSNSRFSWGYSFTADGTSCKAAGVRVPGGVLLTWWK